MTRKEFIALARKTKSWRIDQQGHLRCGDGSCPIIRVQRQLTGDPTWDNVDWAEAAKDMGIRYSVAERIAVSADGEGETYDCRSRLLRELTQ